MSRIRYILTIILVLAARSQALAQDIVKGLITDESNAPLAGAFVMETGAGGNGVISDADGSYSISLKSKGDLQVSFMSYKTQIIKVNGRSVINVKIGRASCRERV